MEKLCILTVVDSVSATSMPVNEFVLYRQRTGAPGRQVLMVCNQEGRKRMRSKLRALKQECKERGESLVCHLHGQKSALVFYRAACGLGLRRHTLYTIHSTYGSRDLKYRLSSCLCTLLAAKANCVSKASWAQYQPLIRRIKGDNLFFITNGVDVERIDAALSGTVPEQADSKRLVCIGRLIPLKNQMFLVRLLPDLPGTKLLLIGQENPSYPVRALAEELGVGDRVEFVGLVPRETVFQLAAGAGLYVSASTVEGLPVSVLEAMAIGLVPVLSDIPPHREIAEECALAKPLPLEPEAWLARILSLQEAGDGLKQEQQKVRKAVREHYSLKVMHEQYYGVYGQLAE